MRHCSTAATKTHTPMENMANSSVTGIVEALRTTKGGYARTAMDAAVAHREAITPQLLQLLEEVLADPNAWCDDESPYGPRYAVVLLGHFREPRAHRVIVDLFRLPEDQVEALFSDLISENLAGLLYATCGGELDAIREMVMDDSVYFWCRAAAADALSFAVLDGFAKRREILTLLEKVLEAQPTDSFTEFATAIAYTMLRLYPDVCRDALVTALDRGLIFGSDYDEDGIESALSAGKQDAFEKLRGDLRRQLPDDVHRYLEWWCCFESASKHSSIRGGFEPMPERPGARPATGGDFEPVPDRPGARPATKGGFEPVPARSSIWPATGGGYEPVPERPGVGPAPDGEEKAVARARQRSKLAKQFKRKNRRNRNKRRNK